MKSASFSLLSILSITKGSAVSSTEDQIFTDNVAYGDGILDAKVLLMSLGVPERNLCRRKALANLDVNDDLWDLPLCESSLLNSEMERIDDFKEGVHQRMLEDEEEEKPTFQEDPLFYLVTGFCALGCVILAAFAAGLTMGMLSLDPLMLLVKIRASRSLEEKNQAEALLPIVKQHHLLLVTLLLLNALANEALPLFLEKLVSPVVSVILSVSFVLIFGEILPSAIFTGPNKLKLASKMVPLVRGVMALLWPITYPIAKMLDKVLHEDDDKDGAFDRGEISALVRIQYEERIANKRQRKIERMDSTKRKSFSNFPHPKHRPPGLENAIKTAKTELSTRDSIDLADISAVRDVQSIHVDEVMMVEGALQMKTKTAYDVFTPIHRMFAVPDNLILNEDNVVDIYSSGYSRIPVYEKNSLKSKSQAAIKGILNSKHLIVVNMNEDRPLSTMPLLIPPCVSPKMNLIELVNLFQTGRYGHFALVCARPQTGTEALKEGKAVPRAAGVMGIITLEDVLEELLQEEIYDENDQMEKEAERIALWVGRQWRRKRKVGRRSTGSIVVEAVQANATSESASLLGTSENSQEHSGLLGSMYQSFQSLGFQRDGS